MKTFLGLALLLTSFATFAGGAGSQSTFCYNKSGKHFSFPSDIRSYQINQNVTVGITSEGNYSEIDMILSQGDERTFEFTSGNSSITIHQKDWFLYDVTIDSFIDGQSQSDTMVCNVN